jgi:hypothetical protein
VSEAWQPLRDYLRADLARQIDHAILNDPDRELRALLAANRERLLNLAVDQLELAALRRALAEREAEEERGVRVNGHAVGKRVAKVQ